MGRMINIGCGKSILEGWENYDNSPSIRLSMLPIWIIRKLNYFISDEAVSYILWLKSHKVALLDARKTLPMRDCSVDVVYTCHMLEHLSKEDAERFLIETFRTLAKNGVLRIVVPDLSKLAADYQLNRDADEFMSKMMVAPPSLSGFSTKLLLFVSGFRHHQWMYDSQSLRLLLLRVGFSEVYQLEPGETKICSPGSLDLFERSEDSLYIEAFK